ncbi:hypothetical protein [Paenibacillus bovis]|uniref:Uncharacterized protein n=1 Tax=Paenibacillus bovis TaxID=1616788 RepID=A0A1X9T3Z3_9BACL|nr:hypothetical protein [Paenibacillus bovis]ARR10653.1 hypothetical protein AR543_p0045 [Paenibacillus bovis]
MIQIHLSPTDQQMEQQYDLTSMQPLERLEVVKQLIHTIVIDGGSLDELLIHYIDRLKQHYQFYSEEGATHSDLQIEPGIHFAAPAPKPKILLQQIHNADKAWTGILFSHDNKRPRYQTYYRCECGNSETTYVYERTKSLPCRNCQKRICIEPATNKGVPKRKEDLQPYRDTFGNYYVGGLQIEEKN